VSIDTGEMMRLVLQTCPELDETWRQWQDEFRDDPEGPPLFTFLHEVASLLEQMLASGHTERIRRVFDLVERLNVEGDRDVQMYATLGILENVQGLAGMEGDDMVPYGPRFEPYLGPVSRRRWERIEAMWAGTLTGSEGLYD
jgi:hypothetical protein